MKTQIAKTLALAVSAIVGMVALTSEANAQGIAPSIIQTQPYVQPQVAPIPQNQFYFGMNIELRQCQWNGTTLRVVGVTPGSPAHQAGLEIGDEIRQVNGSNFVSAVDSFDAGRLMNLFVTTGSGPAPAASGGTQALVVGPVAPGPPVAQMIVRNVRNGQNVAVTVYPTPVGGIGGTPAATATVVGG